MLHPRATAQCVAVGTFLPERRLTNAELAARVDTTDEWIVSRTGIRERRLVEPGTPCSVIATAAGRDCLTRAGVSAETLDGIIVATITGDQRMPATANIVQHALGATTAWGYDLLNACNGFLAALTTAASMIEAGRAKRILVIGADVMSSIINHHDRNTCILFGDGAGAVLLEAGPEDAATGVRGWEMHSDGAGGDELILPCTGSAPSSPGQLPVVYQNGRTVFAHAVRRMAEVADHCLTSQGLTGRDVDLIIPHQANIRIIEATAERLHVPMSQVVVNIAEVGNTTAATLPLALAQAASDGRLTTGTRVLLVAFGGGFTWGACYLQWGRGQVPAS
jgi:3-oxoacyl-[acyl-carrier-protein] synthase-3